jgi:YbbR domain-containing protein
MSFTDPHIATQQVLRRQKKALFQRLRHNFFDKCIALLSGVLLFVFVQTEHNTNPPLSRQMQADIVYDHPPSDLDPEPLPHQIGVTVTGPRLLVESLRANDVRATIDLADKNGETDKPQVVVVCIYSLPRVPADVVSQLHVDGPPTIRLPLYTVKSKEFKVKAPDYPAPAGFHFGTPILKPATVVCSGRKDRMDKIARVVVNLYSMAVLPPNAANLIQGDVDVVPLDREGNIVQNITIDHKVVHMQLPLVENELERNVTVSAPVVPPSPPWTIDSITVDPQVVKIKGMKDRIDRLYTLSTDPINLRDASGSIARHMPLSTPSGVSVYDMQNNPIHEVTVTVMLRKLPTTTPTSADPPSGANKPATPPGNANGGPGNG